MFGFLSEPTPLDKEIERVTRELDNHIVTTDEYTAMLDQLIRLHKLRNEQKSQSVSRDTLVVAGTNLLGILLILHYEHDNIITSQAMRMIRNPK